MKAFIPIDITDARFVSSTIAEPDVAEPAWDSGTTYAEFAQVSVVAADTHDVYESLQSDNLNQAPATSPTYWILKKKTNRFRMFDWNQGSSSLGASPLTVVIRPRQRISAVMLEGLKAATAEITVQNGIGGDVVLSLSKDLLARRATTPYEYCFTPFLYDKVFATFDVPPVLDPVVTITLTHPSGTCEVGRFATGLAYFLGNEDWGSEIDSENYSEITWDKFGKATLNPIPSIPTMHMTLDAKPILINRIQQFKEMANGKAVVWSAMQKLDSFEQSHVLFGVYERFPMVSKNLSQAIFDLTLKGI